MNIKGVITGGTPLILSHQPNNTVKYSLKCLVVIGKMDQYYEGSWPHVRLNRVCLGYHGSQGTGIMGGAQWLLASPCLLLATLLLVCQLAAAGWLVALLRSQQERLVGTGRGSQMPKRRAFQKEIINLQRTLTKFTS